MEITLYNANPTRRCRALSSAANGPTTQNKGMLTAKKNAGGIEQSGKGGSLRLAQRASGNAWTLPRRSRPYSSTLWSR